MYRRLLLNLRYEKVTIYSFLFVFFGTYVACQVTTFSECTPFHLYWQVVPSPGMLLSLFRDFRKSNRILIFLVLL